MGGLNYISTHFNFGSIWSFVVSFKLLSLYSEEITAIIHWLGGWVGPRAGLDFVAKGKILP
jgi:hypothetical protein